MNTLYEKFEKYSKYYSLCQEGREELRIYAKEICKDQNLTETAIKLKNKIADISYNFEFEKELAGINTEKINISKFGAFFTTLAIENMENFYKEKNIPEDILYAVTEDLGVWINRHHDWFGEWGFSQYGWIKNHLRGKIFKLGRLQFEPSKIWRIPPESLGLNLCEGDPFLSVHIPRGGKIDEASCLDSFEKAKKFFPEYLNFDFKAFGCFTWLFDPDFKKLLPKESNILKFQKLFQIFNAVEDYGGLEYIFVNIKKEDIKNAPDDTNLRMAVKNHILSGGLMHSASGYRSC